MKAEYATLLFLKSSKKSLFLEDILDTHHVSFSWVVDEPLHLMNI